MRWVKVAVLWWALVGFLPLGGAWAQSAEDVRAAQSAEDVRALTLRAASYLQEHSVAEATQAFGGEGEFKSGELYINVIDLDGRWVIYPPQPDNRGRSILNFIDADGVELGKAILAQGLAGEGWTRYRWRNPATGTVQAKVTYVKRVPGLPYIVYCGLYR